MKKNLLLFIIPFLFISCDDDIPTSENNLKEVNWNSIKSVASKKDSNIEEDLEMDKNEEISENSLEDGLISDDEVEANSEIVEKEKNLDKIPDYSDYEEKLEMQMGTAKANYPKPPSPANLTAYDSRDSSSYREPTKEETTSGTGNFPPMPPAMYLDN